MNPVTIIGLDVGHSAVKVAAAPSGHFMFRSLATPAVTISDETEAARAARETVEVGGRNWFFGETAAIQSGGSTTSGLSDNWIETPEHTALLKGALATIERKGFQLDSSGMLVLGLPVGLYQRQSDALRKIAGAITDAEVKIVPQPVGPYHALMLDQQGRPAQDRSMRNESWAVIDVGYYTTDFLLMMNGRWVEKASGSAHGVRLAAETLQRTLHEQSVDVDLSDCERAMETKTIRHFGVRKVDAEVEAAAALVVAEVVDKAERLIAGYVRKLDGVILAGGGAFLVAEQLKAKWPNVRLSDVPRFAVAEGFRRFGQGVMLSRAVAQGAA